MYICKKCKKKINEDYGVCKYCGTPVNLPSATNPFNIAVYRGSKRTFTFMGETINFTREMDKVNYYRKQFTRLAYKQSKAFIDDYMLQITNSDVFLEYFPSIFAYHCRPLHKAAVDLLMKMNIYDVPIEKFEQMHLEGCWAVGFYEGFVEGIEETIQENIQLKKEKYDNMPRIFFRGAIGIAAAFAYNFAVRKIAQHDIKNTALTDEEKRALDKQLIDMRNTIIHKVYHDYIDVYKIMLDIMVRAKKTVWIPNAVSDDRCDGLLTNLAANRIPPKSVPSQVALILKLNPFYDTRLPKFLKKYYGRNKEAQELLKYLGY